MVYAIILFILLTAELLYFRIADRLNIVDKPNQRSSHTRIVLRGGGVIFTIALWVWNIWCGFSYPCMLAGVTLAAGVSFIDDIHSLPNSLRLAAQFVALLLLFQDIGILQSELWWLLPIAMFVGLGVTNIYNFMDGVNGITGGYSLAIIIPLFLENEILKKENGVGFVDESLLVVVGLSVLLFCYYNFRTKARCFAGDVGSIGIALILIFCLGRLMWATKDVTWGVFMLVYGVDGMMTIFHRMMLHENLGEAHRKHAYQLMANELKIPHVKVSAIYMAMQFAISLIAIYMVPNIITAHWFFLIGISILVGTAYIVFMKKYYHLHEEYLSKTGRKIVE